MALLSSALLDNSGDRNHIAHGTTANGVITGASHSHAYSKHSQMYCIWILTHHGQAAWSRFETRLLGQHPDHYSVFDSSDCLLYE